MREGDVPYVASIRGMQTLGSRPLPLDVVSDILEDLVPADVIDAFDDLGAIEYDCPPVAGLEGERFTIAARHDAARLRVEIRRADAAADDLLLPSLDSLWPRGPRRLDDQRQLRALLPGVTTRSGRP